MEEETNILEGLVQDQDKPEQTALEEGLDSIYERYLSNNRLVDDSKKALRATTLLTTLARADDSKDIPSQLNAEAIAASEKLLKSGQEYQFRTELALGQMSREAANLSTLRQNMSKFNYSEQDRKVIDTAYNNIVNASAERRAKTALEEAAIERIQSMASADPVQAKVLLDLMDKDKGDAYSTWKNNNIKIQMLRQRAEELDEEYQQSGWGRTIINFAFGLVPTAYNFSRAGIVGDGTIGDFFAVGNSLRKQGETLWNMPMDEFVEYAAKDGELMKNLRYNASSMFGLIDDPAAATDIMENLIASTDDSKFWNNVWGGVEIASAIPWGKVATTTRTLVVNGATKDAVRNLDNAARILETGGEEAMERATGVTAREFEQEASVRAADPTRPGVSLATELADHMAAADKAIDEVMNPINAGRYNNLEELDAGVRARIDEIKAELGRPVKDVDVSVSTTKLPGGQVAHRVTMLIGKLDGFGFASEAAAKRAAANLGHQFEVVETVTEKTVPKFKPESKVEFNSKTVNAEDGESYYHYTVTSKDGDEIPVSFTLHHDTGVAEIDVGGLAVNKLGAKEIRSIAAQISDEVPEIKKFEGGRATGARAKSGKNLDEDGSVASIDAERLRGQTEIVRDMSGQFFIKITKDMPETAWLSGKLQPEQQGFVSRMLGRYIQSVARTSDPLLHGRAVEAGSYINRQLAVINKDLMGIFRRLPATSRKMVGEILHQGQLNRRWYSDDEVHFLMERSIGRRATDAEIAAYRDARLINDMEFRLHNTVIYLDKLQRGEESVKFRARWGEEFDEDVVIDYNLNQIPKDRVYNASENTHYVHGRNPLTTAELEKLKNNGYVMLEFPDAFHLPEGIVTNKVLIKKTDLEIRPLRENQLMYKPGGHTMYADRYFVKQGVEGVQKDTGSKYLLAPKTYRTAANAAEGRKWAEVMNAARVYAKENPGVAGEKLDELFFKSNKSFPTGEEFLAEVRHGSMNLDHPFEVTFDRELPTLYNRSGEDFTKLFNEDELGVNGYYRTTGRMYTGQKGDEVLKDTNGELADILDPYDTMVKSMQQVTRKFGLFDYKQNALTRFQNTYKQYLTADAADLEPGSFFLNAKVAPHVSVEIRNMIEAQRDAIKNVLRFETPEDKVARQRWQSLAEAALGNGDSKLRKMAHDAVWWWKERNPLSAMRGLAFDSKLGMFNIGQLLVQSSTMLSATAMSPKFGLAGMAGLYPMHSYLLRKGSEATLDAMVKKGVWKVMAFDTPQEFKEYARHMYKSGFTSMNGSHIMINDYGPAAHFGSFGEKANTVREHARVFFYTSETWNRLVAYRIAWGKAWEQGLRPIDKQFDLTVAKLADDYSFNMTHESAALWQKGIWSIPTQFWAYNQRMFDAMFGSRFKGWERARLIGLNLGIAGSAGIPGVEAVAELIKEKTGKAPDINSLYGIADRGIIDYINYQATGADVKIGERIGTGGWGTQVVRSLFGNSQFGEVSFADMVGGATYTIGKGVGKTMWSVAKYAAAESGSDMGDHALTKEAFMQMLKEVSTFGNLSKAMMIQQYGLYKSNKGTILADDLPESDAVYAALSFRPAKADEIGYMMAWRKDHDEAIQEVSTKLRNWRQEAMHTGDWEKNAQKANALIRLLPEADRRKVLQRVNNITDDSFYDYLDEKVTKEQSEHDMFNEGNQ